jgi:hypothetical protein
VKGEIYGCDLVALRGDEPPIVVHHHRTCRARGSGLANRVSPHFLMNSISIKAAQAGAARHCEAQGADRRPRRRQVLTAASQPNARAALALVSKPSARRMLSLPRRKVSRSSPSSPRSRPRRAPTRSAVGPSSKRRSRRQRRPSVKSWWRSSIGCRVTLPSSPV